MLYNEGGSTQAYAEPFLVDIFHLNWYVRYMNIQRKRSTIKYNYLYFRYSFTDGTLRIIQKRHYRSLKILKMEIFNVGKLIFMPLEMTVGVLRSNLILQNSSKSFAVLVQYRCFKGWKPLQKNSLKKDQIASDLVIVIAAG